MQEILRSLWVDHNLVYAGLALLVSAIGMICAAVVFSRGAMSRTPFRRRAWAAVSGVVFGIGVWTTHFVALLGYNPGYAVSLDGLTALQSAGIATGGFLVASQVLVGGSGRARRLASAVIATATVAGTHYYDMTGLHIPALIEYDATLVWASILLCLVLFVAACIVLGLKTDHIRRDLAGLVLSLLAVGTHYFTAMAAIRIIPLRGLSERFWSIHPTTLAAIIITGVALALLVAAFAAGLDSTFARLRGQERRRLSMLADAASEAILIADASGNIVQVNTSATQLLSRAREDLIGLPLATAIGLGPQDLSDCIAISHPVSHVISVRGEKVPIDLTCRTLDHDSQDMLVATLRDLRERLKHEADIHQLAFFDQLTGLANRAAFTRELQAALDAQAGSGESIAVLLIDLDKFKDINDQYGHAAGDAVLIETGRRLRKLTGRQEIPGRLGGDEFALLLRSFESEEEVLGFAQEIVTALSEAIPYGDLLIQSGGRVGMALSNSGHGPVSATSLMKHADRALYAVKADGRARAQIYDAALHRQHEERRKLEAALGEAVRNNEFVLHYQPKVCARDSRIIGYEALIRWQRPGHEGLVMPDRFIPVAEQSTLIQEIGRWSLYEACRSASTWPNELSVAVNLSARQFLDPRLYATVRDALRRSGLQPSRLELEITETALISNIHVATLTLERLKKLGIQIALDDFGTGYSSLRFIQQFPFDRIKIDRSFVTAMESDRKSQAVVEAILRLGVRLNIPVVAEGVETEEQVRKLREADCEELQGYYFSRPGPLEEVAVLKPGRAAA